MLWQKYLTQVLSLQSRAKQLEDSIHFSSLFDKELLPSQLLRKLSIAKQAKTLYTKAHRMSTLLEETRDVSMADITQLVQSLQAGIRRVTQIVKILDHKASKFGVGDIKEEPSFDGQMDAFVGEDANAAEDMGNIVDLDELKIEVKHSLKALADIIQYMEKPTLLKIRKEIDRLVNY